MSTRQRRPIRQKRSICRRRSARQKQRREEPELLLNQRAKVGRISPLEWVTLVASLALVAFSVFMIRVGSCSHPLSKRPKYPMCKGNYLSVQTWLAIVGIEFAIFGSIMLPRLRTLVIAKTLTKRLLSDDGVSLSSILNLQAGAPLRNQAREGMRRALFRQILIPVLVIAGSISYKFSFVTMSIPSIIQLDCGLVPLGGSALGWTVFTDNMIDIVEPNRVDAISTGRNGSDLIMGPSFNYSRTNTALYGSRLHLCYPTYYARSNISTTNDPSRFPNDVANQTADEIIQFTSDDLGQLVKLSVSKSYSLQALAGYTNGNSTSWKYFTNITTNICWGYISWTKLNKTLMDNPSDILCSNERFDLAAWNASSSHVVANGVIQSRLAFRNASSLDIPSVYVGADKAQTANDITAYFLNIVVEAILASINHTAVLDELFPPARDADPFIYELPSNYCLSGGLTTIKQHPDIQAGVMLIEGIIANSGTGMTATGFILQIFLLLIALCGFGIFLWPSLPLIQEWPAQWITLVSQLERSILEQALIGTSTGENIVSDVAGTVYLRSVPTHHGAYRLALVREHGGQIQKGESHV